MNASDAHYNSIIRDLHEMIERDKASAAAKEAGATKYWYFIYEDYCPVCGRSDPARTRMYTPRPEAYEERHRFSERYDWCEG